MAKNKLQEYFPMIRTREEVLEEIRGKDNLLQTYESWRKGQQEEFLDFCTGVRGVKLLYDSFFKTVFNPELVPERLEELLSLMLKRKVKILQVLPNDGTRIADENTLLITDIVVELEDGSIANVEIQKIGYAFPGQRCACYSSDLLLRQYQRIRGERGKKFSYRDIKSVYTIILFEESTKEFKKFPDTYMHYFKQQSDTGLELELLQEYLMISLDNFLRYIDNKSVETELEAWLAFLSCDAPEKIQEVAERYPKFRKLYEEVYTLCRNVEEVMSMFSKELQELDRNTVQYMIDEQKEEIEKLQRKNELNEEKMRQQEKETIHYKQQIDQLQKRLAQLESQLEK